MYKEACNLIQGMEDQRISPSYNSACDRAESEAPTGNKEVDIVPEEPDVGEIHNIDKVAEAGRRARATELKGDADGRRIIHTLSKTLARYPRADNVRKTCSPNKK